MTSPTDRDAAALLREIEVFLFDEVELIDEGRLDEWVGLFTEDGEYWVPSEPNQDDAQGTASIIHEGVRVLEVRAQRLRHERMFANVPAVRACHVIGNVRLRETAGANGPYRVTATFVMLEYRADRQRTFGGKYDYRLRRDDGALKIERKRVDLLNCDAPHGALLLPF